MKLIAFSSPVDASNYVPGGSQICPGIALHSINILDTQNVYVFQLQNPDGTLNPAKNGVNVLGASEGMAPVDIRAAIAATILA